MPDPTVSAGYTKALMDLAIARGAKQVALLSAAGLNPQDLADPEARLPFARFKALMGAAKSLTEDPALALRFGESSPFDKMSIVGLIANRSETMGEALKQLNRYGRLVIDVDDGNNGERFARVPDKHGLWIEDRRQNPNDFPELTESTWARFVCDTERLFPGARLAKAVHFTHPEPSYVDEYQRIFAAPITFNATRNALLMDPSWADRPLGGSNQYVFGIFSERAQALLDSLEGARTTRGQVEHRLIPILHTGDTSMDLIARKMGLSRATLYRQLKSEGVVFEALLDDLRCKMALHYLDGKAVSVSQTAYLVGFSDPSAFSRAFKRWTGRSPAQRPRV
jgi:AraC-like DNA-binding protein